jgi:hypothetical protein
MCDNSPDLHGKEHMMQEATGYGPRHRWGWQAGPINLVRLIRLVTGVDLFLKKSIAAWLLVARLV